MKIVRGIILIYYCLHSFLSFSQRIDEDIQSVMDLAVTDNHVKNYIFTSKLRGENFAYVMPTKEIINRISNYTEFYDSIATTESEMAPFAKTRFGQLYLIIDPFHSNVIDISKSLNTVVIVVKKFKMDYHSAKLVFCTSSLSPKKDDSFKYIKVTCKARWDGAIWVIDDVHIKNSSFIQLIH